MTNDVVGCNAAILQKLSFKHVTRNMHVRSGLSMFSKHKFVRHGPKPVALNLFIITTQISWLVKTGDSLPPEVKE
jgi:hypothetical protein